MRELLLDLLTMPDMVMMRDLLMDLLGLLLDVLGLLLDRNLKSVDGRWDLRIVVVDVAHSARRDDWGCPCSVDPFRDVLVNSVDVLEIQRCRSSKGFAMLGS